MAQLYEKTVSQSLPEMDPIQSAASHVALSIRDLHRLQGATTQDFLKSWGIITNTTGTPIVDAHLLSSPTSHDDINRSIQSLLQSYPDSPTLQPPADDKPYPGAPSNTALEWASIFHDTASLLSSTLQTPQLGSPAKLPRDRRARPRLPNVEDPWEGMLVNGAYESPAWEMVTVYEAEKNIGCAVADPTATASRSQDSLFRSELYCLLALLHRQLSTPLATSQNGFKMVTVTCFTTHSVRVHQAYIDSARAPHKIHVLKQLDTEVKDIVGSGDGTRSQWLDILSWLQFTPGQELCVCKQRARDDNCHEAERQFSSSSTSAHDGDEWPSESSSVSSR